MIDPRLFRFPVRDEAPSLDAPPPQGFTPYATFDRKEQRQTSIHMVPLDDVVHSCDKNGECICGPHLVMNDELPVYRHWPLRTDYYEMPGGPDGPVEVPI